MFEKCVGPGITKNLTKLSITYFIIYSSILADNFNVKIKPNFLLFRPVIVSCRKLYNLSR